jgi:hypothetical protein
MLFLSGGLALATLGQTQDSSPQRPWVINSTYTLTAAEKRTITIHLHEEDGQLTIDEKQTNFPDSSLSVKYDEVNFVEVLEFGYQDDLSGKKRIVRIGTSRTTYMALGRFFPQTVEVILPTEADADAVAEYVARKASVHLELIAGAWRVRKPFECPEAALPGCKDFKELLDHDDPDIADYFYSYSSREDERVYACFDSEESHFLMVKYSRHGKRGRIDFESFRNGQSNAVEPGKIDWSSGEFGEIIQLPTQKEGQKAQALGLIDSSSLSYHTRFANRMNTTTQYQLSIRWSTGRYTESWSGKNDKGKPFSETSSGICVKLN